MKTQKTKSQKLAFIAGALFCAAGILSAQAANSTLVTFSVDLGAVSNPGYVAVSGSFNAWGQLNLVQEGSSTVYTNTVNDTADANGGVLQYKFTTSADGTSYNYEGTADYNNRAVILPSTSGASLILPTPFYNDAGTPVAQDVTFQVDMSQQINLGLFTNDSSVVTVNGNFNGWTGVNAMTHDPSIMITNQYGLVTSNVYTTTFSITNSPYAAMDYKFVENGNYEVNATLNDGGGNRFFAMPVTSPLTNALFFFGDAPYAPLSQVTFSVDMSAQLQFGNWSPSYGVFCQGINGDWNNDAVNTMTNNPGASNTNLYYVTYTLGQGSANGYKFTYNGPGGTVYEQPSSTGGNNRSYTVPLLNSVSVPTVYFSDVSPYDLLSSNIDVTFSVNMTNAVQYGTTTAFNPGSDFVFVNSAAFTGSWQSWDPISLSSYLLTNNPPSLVYSGTFSIPAGTALNLVYKYGINGADNEAGNGSNHGRYIRTTATGAYTLPMDTFGNQYNEPAFGQLAVKSAAGGNIALSWLGAPNVQVQTSTSLTGNNWVSHPETGGAVWSSGVNSTNGLISVTNWPASTGNLFFRLIQQ